MIRLIHYCSKGLYRHLKARNVTTIIWVVNYQEDLVELKDMYGDELMGVMTDKPTLLRNYIDDV